MSSWRNSGAIPVAQSENGPRAKCDQVVFEAIAKAAEIVVGSRCWIDGGGVGHNNLLLPPGSMTNSSRFNLLVPEVQGVRSILQRWKRALHVPLRLDVYYQHKDSRRELLERWCLEYAPKLNNHAGGSGTPKFLADDPIIQLRQVCKQIVVWLRTLYCWSRMLPAQALRQRHNNPIGFSIYVVSEGNDDVTGLVQNQGFHSQGQPHNVTTPYGELGWKVFYAPKQPLIQRLLPEKAPYSTVSTGKLTSNATTKSQPIPMQQQHQQQQQQQYQSPSSSYHKRHLLQRRESASPTPTATAHSAPQSNGRMYRRANSATPGMISDPSHPNPMELATSLKPMRANSGLSSFANQQQPQQLRQRQSDGEDPLSGGGGADKPPTKSMSGLSLAMMQSDENIDGDDNKSNPTTAAASKEESSTAEKRRAALHHAPPQFGTPLTSSPILKKSLASAGEYGYAYNNHIAIPNNGNNNNYRNFADDAHVQQSPRASTPTTPLASTPPGYLFGGPTPPAMLPSNLIPPRSAVTPPFVRPMGFVGEPPSQPLPPPASSQAAGNHNATSNDHPNNPTIPNLKASHQTSLDLLHSSPFQQVPHHGSALFHHYNHGPTATSSLLPPASLQSFSDYHNDPSTVPSMLPSYQHMFYDPVHHHTHHHFAEGGGDDDEDDMPFAVDSTDPADGGDGIGGANSSHAFGGANNNAAAIGGASTTTIATVASVPPRKKLALFESIQLQQQQQSNLNSISSLADQLAEFKSFGASLNLGNTTATTTSNE